MGMAPNWMTVLQGGGAMLGAAGAYKSAAGQKAALQYQAGVSDSNARIAEEQARFALLNGQQQEQAVRLKTAALLGDQKAIVAANGVDVHSGSPLELMASAKAMGEQDAFTIRDNAARQAWAFGEQAKGYRTEAGMDRSTAGAMSPWMAATGSLLTSAGTVADKWYRYRESTAGKTGG